MNNRIKRIRKDLGLSQEDFGAKIGLSGSSVSMIERGERPVTEQTAKLICSVFNVSIGWLRLGEGEPFYTRDENILTTLDTIMTGEDEFAKAIFRAFATMGPEEWKAVRTIVEKVKGELDD